MLFLFFDGIGLGADDPAHNPFAAADLPTLYGLTGGQRWLEGIGRVETERAIFTPLDACLGVEGRPQSATGQATIMTGVNVPQRIGRHWGPKPTPEIRAIIDETSITKDLSDAGHTVGLVNAYPSAFFDAVESGKRLLSSNQYALRRGGVTMLDGMAFYEGRAISIDFTGEMWFKQVAAHDAAYTIWREEMEGLPEDVILAPYKAGQRLAELARSYDFAFFDQWLTDYFGHRGTLEQAVELLERFDRVLAGLLEAWDDGLILLTSDHGNMEAIDERGHTETAVPALIIGEGREAFADGLTDLTGIAPAIRRHFGL